MLIISILKTVLIFLSWLFIVFAALFVIAVIIIMLNPIVDTEEYKAEMKSIDERLTRYLAK